MLQSQKRAYSVRKRDFERGLIEETHSRGLYLARDLLIESEADVDLPRLARDHFADGLLINYSHHIPDCLNALIHQNELPAVWINTKREVNCVRPDDYGAAARATRLLIAHGHRRIHMLDLEAVHEASLAYSHYSQADRVAGYRDVMREAGLPCHEALASPCRPGAVGEVGYRVDRIARALTADPAPTAVINISDSMVTALAAARAGIRVPEDLSIIVFDDTESTEQDVAMTRMLIPMREMGRRVICEVCELIEDPSEPRPVVVLPMALEDRGSVGPMAMD